MARMMRGLLSLLLLGAVVGPWVYGADQDAQPPASALPKPVQLTKEQDHQRLRELLKIGKLRPGANGSNKAAPNYANYDESKANPFPRLPDPLVLKNGQKVTTPEMWWNQ